MVKKLCFGVIALLLGLVLTSQVSAAGPRGHSHGHYHGKPYASRSYYQSHGHRFNGGYYFSGRAHDHWGYKVWNAQYRRYHYWEPSLRCYYYYCPERCGYYPCGGGF